MKYFISFLVFTIILIFASCENSNQAPEPIPNVENTTEIYLTKGKRIAGLTFSVLSGNLQKAMKEGGVSHAIEYCNLAALPLVDSLSKVYEAEIRRTSLQIRNPKDKPTSEELKQLNFYKKQVESGEELKPVVKELPGDRIAFYAPIKMMSLCERCHGKVGSTLVEKNYQTIQKLYPQDEAINYASGDWRGMWSITFNK